MARIESLSSLQKNSEFISARLFGAVNTDKSPRIISPGRTLSDSEETVFAYNPISVRLSPNSEYDHKVKQIMSSIYNVCEAYMTEAELRKIDIAFGLMHYGHQNQKREDNKHPYSIHTLSVAQNLIHNYQVDWETVAAALCHDLLEDSRINGFPVKKKDLSIFLSDSVAQTVEALSKVEFDTKEGRHNVDDETRAVLFESISINPRPALIKIYDRLHNMDTLESMPPHNRKEKATETLKYYVPLAQFLGLYDEANELALYSLRELDSKFTGKLEQVLKEYKSIMSTPKKELTVEPVNELITEEEEGFNQLNLVKRKIEDTLHIHPSMIDVRFPDVYAIYKNMGQKREPTVDDCFLAVDIGIEEGKNILWHGKANNYEYQLATSNDFGSIRSIPYADIKAQLEAGIFQSFESILQVYFGHPTNLKVNMFPSKGAILSQYSIADIYYHWFKSDNTISDVTHDMDSDLAQETTTHNLGFAKWLAVQERIRTTSEGLEGGALGRKFLDFVIPGKMTVKSDETGMDWPLDEGSSVLDYVVDRYSDSDSDKNWKYAKQFFVNDQPVSPYYLLRQNDVVSVEFQDKIALNPGWIRALKTTTEFSSAKSEIRDHFKEKVKNENEIKERFDSLKREARHRIEEKMSDRFRTNIEKVTGAMNMIGGEENLQDFIVKLALDEIDQEFINKVASEIQKYQEIHFVYFSVSAKDTEGLHSFVNRILTVAGNKTKRNLRLSQGIAGVWGTKDDSRLTFIFDLSELYPSPKVYYKIKKELERVTVRIMSSKKYGIRNKPEIRYPKGI